jgi:oxygen-independent coproporphyrinogen-3 oxidase
VERHLAQLSKRFEFSGFSTIYIGGGTPSFLPPDILSGALSAVANGGVANGGVANGGVANGGVANANPEDIDAEFLSVISSYGVNRLSIGVQTLEDGARRLAGRRGSADATRRILDMMAARWPDRCSADLMYGLPAQSATGLAKDVRALVDRGFGHISLYELTLEDGTPMERGARAGTLALPDDDERADQYDAACEELLSAGFNHYEVSNWALPGQECIHNMHYWNMDDWLAVGPSGVGNVNIGAGRFMRLENSADDAIYFDDPSGSVQEVLVTGLDAMFESLMLALRTRRGFGLVAFAERFGHDAVDVFGPLHELFTESVILEAGRWRATARGMDTLNRVLVRALSNGERFYDRLHGNDGGTR